MSVSLLIPAIPFSPNGRHSVIGYKPDVETTKRQYGVRGRKDGLWLRKRICERAGLLVREQSSRHQRFGWRAYLVEIPEHLPRSRAVQSALRMRQRRKLLRLGHVANGLLIDADRNPFWLEHTLARFTKPRGS